MDNDDKEKSPLEKLEKVVYSSSSGDKKGQDGFVIREREIPLRPKEYDLEKKWKEEDPSQRIIIKKEKSMNFLNKIFIGSIIFFVLSALVAFFMFYGGGNIISSRNVGIAVAGPSFVGGGEIFPLQIAVQNNNTTQIESVNIIVEYPEGTYSAEDRTKKITRISKNLDNISANGVITYETKSIFFGEEGSVKDIVISVEYKISGSNAFFSKEKKYEVTLGSSPVEMSISSPKEVISGNEALFTIEVVSNSNTIIGDLLVSAEYPFGVEFKDSSPMPSYDNNIWRIGDLKPGEKRIITIRTVIVGQDEEDRVFRFYSGLSDDDERIIDTIFSSSLKSLIIKKPFIALDFTFNGENNLEYIANVGDDINSEIIWSNNLPDKIVDVEIVANLSGSIINKSSVSVNRGFYQSSNNTIIWNKDQNGELSEIIPGQKGKVSFRFSPYDLSRVTNYNLKNPEIILDVKVKGRRVSEKGVPEEISSAILGKIKISSNLMLTSRVVHFIGPFNNTGPIPPTVGKETTYTVIWTITNTSNNVSGARVSAVLPTYVSWMGKISPSEEDITFNPMNNQIIWDIGNVPEGLGVSNSSKEVAFQVSFLPSVSQVGISPYIVDKMSITGQDDFTGADLKDDINAMTTRMGTDPRFGDGDDRVIE